MVIICSTLQATRLRQVVDSLAGTSLLWLGMANKMLQKKKKKKNCSTLPPYLKCQVILDFEQQC